MTGISLLPGSVVGIPSKEAWSTTVVWHWPQAQVCAAVAFTGSEEAPLWGRRWITNLAERSELGLSEFYQSLKQDLQELPGDCQISGAFLWQEGENLTVMTFGHGRVALSRNQTAWRWLCSGEEVEHVLQGHLRAGDIFLLLTSETASLQGFPNAVYPDPETATVQLVPMVQRLNSQSGVGILCLQVQDSSVAENEKTSGPKRMGVRPSVTESSESSPPEPDQYIPPRVMQPKVSHLISPEKISQGVSAAQQSVPRQRGISFHWQPESVNLNWVKRLHIWRFVAVIALVVAVVSAVFVMRRIRTQEEFTTVVVPLQELTQQLESMPEDQRFAQRDAAQSLLERLNATQVSYSSNKAAVTKLTQRVQPIFDRTAAEQKLENLPVYFDFRLVDQAFLSSRAARNGDSAIFIDPAQNKALQLELETKRSESVSVTGIQTPKDLAVGNGGALAWLTSNQVLATTLTNPNPLVLTNLATDRAPEFLERYGDFLYAADPVGKQLWRLDAAQPSSPSGWIRSARGVDLSLVSSLSIDGDIWLGSSQGDVWHLSRGERVDFAITGLVEPLSESILLATTAEGPTLAVVEPAKQRVLFVNKETGEYLRQVSSPQIGAVTDVFWDEEEQFLYLVAGSVLYRVE